jgi:hypothetical protein
MDRRVEQSNHHINLATRLAQLALAGVVSAGCVSQDIQNTIVASQTATTRNTEVAKGASLREKPTPTAVRTITIRKLYPGQSGSYEYGMIDNLSKGLIIEYDPEVLKVTAEEVAAMKGITPEGLGIHAFHLVDFDKSNQGQRTQAEELVQRQWGALFADFSQNYPDQAKRDTVRQSIVATASMLEDSRNGNISDPRARGSQTLAERLSWSLSLNWAYDRLDAEVIRAGGSLTATGFDAQVMRDRLKGNVFRVTLAG